MQNGFIILKFIIFTSINSSEQSLLVVHFTFPGYILMGNLRAVKILLAIINIFDLPSNFKNKTSVFFQISWHQ